MHRPTKLARGGVHASLASLEPGSTQTRERSTIALLTIALAALAVPVLLAPIPPLLDYPNHLVRLWLIAGGANSPPLSEMYAVSWSSAYTNVGIDYLGAALGRFLPIVPLGSVLVVLALVLPPLGAVALIALYSGARTGGRWLSPSSPGTPR